MNIIYIERRINRARRGNTVIRGQGWMTVRLRFIRKLDFLHDHSISKVRPIGNTLILCTKKRAAYTASP